MTTTAYGVENTFPFYLGLDGTALQGGNAYFGVAGQNPVTNPITVYWDSAGTQPAAQPIAIQNGRTVRTDGTPARVWTNSDYSKLVQDSVGRQVVFETNQPTMVGAADAINQATTAAGTASTQAGVATTQAGIATSSAAQAAMNVAITGVYANAAASNVPQGLTPASVGAITAGASGTNGTFALAWSGGNFSINPTGTFTVAGGVLTAVAITGPGLYIGGAPTVPTPSFAASAGLTGAAVALTAQFLVTSGQGYWVQSSDGTSLLRYKNVSGVATADSSVGPIPTTANFKSTAKDVLEYGDADGNLDLRWGAPVNVQTPLAVTSAGIDASNLTLLLKSYKYRLAIGDTDGNLGFATDLSGRVLGDLSVMTGHVGAYPNTGTYDYDINQVFGYGQSLSVGQAYPAISTTQKYDNLMFTAGMRPQYDYPSNTDVQNYGSFVPAVEINSPNVTWATTLGETTMTGFGDAVKERILVEDGVSYSTQGYQLALSTPGFGSTTIANLSKGSAHYARMMTQAGYGVSNSATLNKSYAVQAVTWMQGENDYLGSTTQAAYLASLNQLVSDLSTDLKAQTGQTKNIPLISYQIASHLVGGSATPSIALAQLQAANNNALVKIAMAMYAFDYQDTNNFHLTPTSERWAGAYFALAYKRVVIDGVSWSPLQPVSSKVSGKIAALTFHVPVGSLTLDTTLVALNTNYGFQLVDSVGNPLTISSVSIRKPNVVRIVAAATIPAGAHVRYAWAGSGGNVGNQVGPRGNLRDQQGDFISFDPTWLNKPMHNWCVIFDWGL